MGYTTPRWVRLWLCFSTPVVLWGEVHMASSANIRRGVLLLPTAEYGRRRPVMDLGALQVSLAYVELN